MHKVEMFSFSPELGEVDAISCCYLYEKIFLPATFPYFLLISSIFYLYPPVICTPMQQSLS